jgi:xanthine dehydrogenase molybdopterin-binding subunit B
MPVTTGRCPVDVTYDVGFRPDGKLTALRLRGGMLAGHAKDLSDSDIDMLRQGSDMVRLCGKTTNTRP